MNAPGPDLDPVAARLRLVVARLHRRMRVNSRGLLTPSQLSAVVTLAVDGPLRIGELAAREGVSAPTMTRVVACLEELGLLSRRADAADARSSIVELSDDGRRELDRIRVDSNKLLAALLDGLTPADQAAQVAALPALERLVAEFDESSR
jgi:DNA-binding MarR family transcriptional regulator